MKYLELVLQVLKRLLMGALLRNSSEDHDTGLKATRVYVEATRIHLFPWVGERHYSPQWVMLPPILKVQVVGVCYKGQPISLLWRPEFPVPTIQAIKSELLAIDPLGMFGGFSNPKNYTLHKVRYF